MSQPLTVWEQLRWDLLALVVLIIAVGGYAALQSPSFQPAELVQVDGSKPPDRSEGDVLLVVPTAPAARAINFETMDCTFTWFNILWQYFGTFAMAPSDALSPQLLAGHATVVVPSRVATELGSRERGDLEEFTHRGGQLIVEAPRQEWESITGVSTVGPIGRARTISSVDGLAEEDPLRKYLADVPLSGRLLPGEERPMRPDGSSIFAIGDQPALVVEPLGEGHVYSVLFDFACSILAMHQGKPTRELDFGTPDGDHWIPTSRRVAYEKLTTTSVPYADVLQRALFERVIENRPLARLWPFPGSHSGAAMTIHAARHSPRAVFGYADWARKQEASSTLFAAPDRFTASHAALADEVGSDVGLLWVLGVEREPVTEGVGFGAIEPWRRELSLSRQHVGLQTTIPQRSSPSLVRTEATLWQADWDSTFRTIAAAGLAVDTSFGPGEKGQYGYLFGTAMPYYPLDSRGRPLPVLELPFVLDGANITTDRLRELFDHSAGGFHQPITLSLSGHAMQYEPAVGVLLGYRSFHDLAREHDHWLTNVSDYVDFLAARRHSVVTSQWSPEEGRLTVSVNLVGARLDTAPQGAIASLAVPEIYDGRSIERIDIDDDEVEVVATARSGFGHERLIELPPGRHVVSVFYETPPEDHEDDEESSP